MKTRGRKDLLKEAIADAKAVKQTALANAKIALEEAFTPRLQSMLSHKIAEELEDEDIPMEEEEEFATTDTEEYMGEEDEMGDEFPVEEEEEMGDEFGAVEEDDDEMGGEFETEEPADDEEMGDLDLESIIRELEGEEEDVYEEEEENPEITELRKIRERVSRRLHELESSEIGAGDNKVANYDSETEDEQGTGEFFEEEGEEEESEEEVKIDEMKKEMEETEKVDEIVGSGTEFAQLADTLGVGIDAAKYLVVAGGLAVPAILAAIKVGGDKAIQFFKKMAMKKAVAETEEMEEMKSELEEAYNTIKTIKEELSEVNLFNAKLLYTNKIFKAKNLTESQKVKVLAAFDKAASVKEAKLVFETLSEGFKEKKSPVNESMLRGSASKPAGIAEKKPIMEVNDQFSRWQKLAGIK